MSSIVGRETGFDAGSKGDFDGLRPMLVSWQSVVLCFGGRPRLHVVGVLEFVPALCAGVEEGLVCLQAMLLLSRIRLMTDEALVDLRGLPLPRFDRL